MSSLLTFHQLSDNGVTGGQAPSSNGLQWHSVLSKDLLHVCVKEKQLQRRGSRKSTCNQCIIKYNAEDVPQIIFKWPEFNFKRHVE